MYKARFALSESIIPTYTDVQHSLVVYDLSQQTGLHSLGQSTDYTGLFMISTSGKAHQSTCVVSASEQVPGSLWRTPEISV